MHDPSLAINIIHKKCGEPKYLKIAKVQRKKIKAKEKIRMREKSAEGNNTQMAVAIAGAIVADADAAAVSAAEKHKLAVRGKGCCPIISLLQNSFVIALY